MPPQFETCRVGPVPITNIFSRLIDPPDAARLFGADRPKDLVWRGDKAIAYRSAGHF